MKKYRIGFCTYTEDELWKFILILSNFRMEYNPFDAEEAPKYLSFKAAGDALRSIVNGYGKERV